MEEELAVSHGTLYAAKSEYALRERLNTFQMSFVPHDAK